MVASRSTRPTRKPKERAKAVKDKKPRAKKKHEADPQMPLTRALTLVPKTGEVPPSQSGMFDHELTSSAMYALVKKKHELGAAAKAFNKVQKEFRESFKALCKEQKIRDGQRIRITSGEPEDVPFAMNAKRRQGGGHTVGTWESLAAVDIHQLPAK